MGVGREVPKRILQDLLGLPKVTLIERNPCRLDVRAPNTDPPSEFSADRRGASQRVHRERKIQLASRHRPLHEQRSRRFPAQPVREQHLGRPGRGLGCLAQQAHSAEYLGRLGFKPGRVPLRAPLLERRSRSLEEGH